MFSFFTSYAVFFYVHRAPPGSAFITCFAARICLLDGSRVVGVGGGTAGAGLDTGATGSGGRTITCVFDAFIFLLPRFKKTPSFC